MTFEEALLIHIIKNNYTWSKAAATLEAFEVKTVGRLHPLSYRFTEYVRNINYISNESMMHLITVSHYLTSQTQDSQSFILNHILKSK